MGNDRVTHAACGWLRVPGARIYTGPKYVWDPNILWTRVYTRPEDTPRHRPGGLHLGGVRTGAETAGGTGSVAEWGHRKLRISGANLSGAAYLAAITLLTYSSVLLRPELGH